MDIKKMEFELPEELAKEYLSFCFLSKQNTHVLAYKMFLVGIHASTHGNPLFNTMRKAVELELKKIEMVESYINK